jgi:rhodanese-related sulfurtransferase
MHMHSPFLLKFTVLLFVLGLCQSPMANAEETPAAIPGAKISSAGEVKRMLDSGVPVVDTRVGNEFAESHIRGSISVPYKEHSRKARDFDAGQDSFDLAKLPADKGKPIVFYCNSGECWKSYKATTVAVRAGYRQVYWFRGGLPEWKNMGLPVD